MEGHLWRRVGHREGGEGGTLKNCLRVGVSASPVREILPRRMDTCGGGEEQARSKGEKY